MFEVFNFDLRSESVFFCYFFLVCVTAARPTPNDLCSSRWHFYVKMGNTWWYGCGCCGYGPLFSVQQNCAQHLAPGNLCGLLVFSGVSLPLSTLSAHTHTHTYTTNTSYLNTNTVPLDAATAPAAAAIYYYHHKHSYTFWH